MLKLALKLYFKNNERIICIDVQNVSLLVGIEKRFVW